MKIFNLATAVITLCLVFMFSCDKSEDPTTVSLTLKDATEVTETGFTANWTSNSADIKSITIELSLTDDFNPVIKTISATKPTSNNQIISGLSGAKLYYYRLVSETNNGDKNTSNVKSITTSFESKDVKFITSDNLEIAGKLSYLGSMSSKRPGVIFMHELGVWVNNWKKSDVVTELVSRGYVCLVFDFRGHGNSDPIDDLGVLIEDWSLIGNDLKAAIQYLQTIEFVQGNSIGLVGASLGGIMAIAGNGFDEVKTSVALSAPRNGTQSLFPGFKPQSVYYIAGENDARPEPPMNFADEATHMYDHSDDPKKLTIIEGSSIHGTDLLIDKNLSSEVVNWVDTHLKN